MRRQRMVSFAVLVCLLFAMGSALAESPESCTIAVVSGSVTTDSRPLLWKNRDTDYLDQEVRYFDDGSHGGYITVVSTGIDETSTAYVGVNDEGFSIMNANAPDLNTGSPTSHGILMKLALKECESVADFEALLIATSGSRGHIWSNFGVIDRFGDAAIFETNDWDYRRYDADSEGGFIVRTNFSVWGGGAPGSRYERAYQLISSAAGSGQLDHGYMVQTVSKDIGGPPSMPCGQWPTTDPAISRYKTRSAAVVHGVLPSEDPRLSTFWCILGEPSCGVGVPLWSYAGTPPPEMSVPGQLAPMCAEIQEKELYCYNSLTDDTTIDTHALVGDDGQSGIQGYSLPIEVEAFDDAAAKLADWRVIFPPASEIAQFQSERASRTYLYFNDELAPGDEGKPNRDIDVAGTRSGSYLDAWVSDDVCESIEEQESHGNPGRRYSFLEHKWTTFVEPGNQITFHLEAYHTANLEGDDFIFAYSVDDTNYTDMLFVTKTADDDACQSFTLPPSLNGEVYVRVQDADRTPGNRAHDTIFIDYMLIESSTAPDCTPPLISNVAASEITSSAAVITWDTDEYSNSVVLYDTDGGPDYDFVASTEDMVLDHCVLLTDLSASTGYHYVVASTDASENTATSSEHSFTTASGEHEMHIAGIDVSLRQNGPFTRGVAAVTVVSDGGIPIADATVETHWTGLTTDTDQFTTEPDGVGSCDSDKIKDPVGWFVLTIDNVFKDGWAYNPEANVETSDSTFVGRGHPLTSGRDDIPHIVALRGSFPNPFKAETRIRYAIPEESHVMVRIYDTCGRLARTLVDASQPAGLYRISWNGTDGQGEPVDAGVYFYSLSVGDKKLTKRLVVVR